MGRSRVSDEQLREAAPQARNLGQLLSLVGLVPCGGNYEIVRQRLRLLGLLERRFVGREGRLSPSSVVAALPRDRLVAAAAASVSYAQLLRAVGLEADPSLVRPLRPRLQEVDVSTEHFRSRGWSRDVRRPLLPLEEVLVAGRPTASGALRRRLIAEGLREAMCEACGLTAWRGRPIALDLDHVNGIRDDNRLANLRLLCPNCHAQTDTWRGRDIGRSTRGA